MQNYTVLTPVEHDQVRFDPGETIGLEDGQAAPLLASGAIEGPVKVAAEPQAAAKKGK